MRSLAWLLVALLVAGCAQTVESPPTATSPAGASTPSPSPSPPATTSATGGAPTGTTPPAMPQGTPTPPPGGPREQPPVERPGPRGGDPACVEGANVTFTQLPMRAEDFGTIVPYGLVVDAHVTPIDHMYFGPADRNSPRDAYEVRMIADGTIYQIGHRGAFVGDHVPEGRVTDEWRLDIQHTCTFTSYFDLLTNVTPEIREAYERWRAEGGPRPFLHLKAGDLVGRIGGQTLDFGVYDYTVTLPGFVVPEQYAYEPWKVHTVDPFPHFAPELRDVLLERNPRKAEPRAGKIDHDIDGRLQGNWFEVGTNGYAGADRSRYWAGHLAIVPDHLDPTAMRVSIGTFDGAARQFAVRGNGLDAANVSRESGPVEVELVLGTYVDAVSGARNPDWHALGANVEPRLEPGEDVLGVALFELVEDRLLRFEAFPGKRAADVAGFTDAARLYER